MTQSKRKLLSVAERVNIIFGAVEDAMTRLTKIAATNAHGVTTDVVRRKREEEVRHELRRYLENTVRGRGRDVLELLREFVEENCKIVWSSDSPYGADSVRYLAVERAQLLSVIDAGFMAEDDGIVGERCPNCERAVSEHSRVDLYGTDAVVCMGAPRDGIVVTHPEALSRLVQAATNEAQRQFDELTKGSEARTNAEDYAAIVEIMAGLPREQLEEFYEEGLPVSALVREMISRGPVLERGKLERVLQDTLRASLEAFKYLQPTEDAPEWALEDFIQEVPKVLANVLKGVFPVRVEYFSQEEVERVERARREPAPPVITWPANPMLSPEERAVPTIELPGEMVEGQTHWLIGNDYGLFYKVDAEGKVTRLENEYTRLHEERTELAYVEQTSNMHREYKGEDSTLTCPCGSSVSWKGLRSDEVNAWITEHAEHEYTTSEDAEDGHVLASEPEPSSSE